MKVSGFYKTTLIDYPEKLASSIFLNGCNLRCPFCHNGDLVLPTANQSYIDLNYIFEVLKKRKNILEGVCISGGEPTIHHDLYQLCSLIKGLRYSIKLDTNGTNPDILRSLYNDGLIDYVAMDVKNSKEKYSITTGNSNMDLTKIESSIDWLLTSGINYEFRTTVVKELHNKEDFIKIGQWISGAKRYYLQNYRESDNVIQPGFTSYTQDELLEFVHVLNPFVSLVELREVDS